MDFDYRLLTRVQSDRELWEISENSYSNIEEARKAVGELLFIQGFRATDVKIVQECNYSIQITE